MNENAMPAYGLWPMVIINAAVFIIFAFSFTHPQSKRDWRSFGAFSAFLVALFTEMYGFPLTIYLLSGWLASRYPALDLFSHQSGHLWSTILGLKGDPHFSQVHFLSELLIAAGFIIIIAAWKVLYRAQLTHQIAMTGPYAYLRHPQYVGFTLLMIGFLVQWPTIPTLIMFPVLLAMYVRLARREEQESVSSFGEAYTHYALHTPAFFPRLSPVSVKPNHPHL